MKTLKRYRVQMQSRTAALDGSYMNAARAGGG